MEKRNKLKRALRVIFAAAVMLFTHFLYVSLSARGTREPLMFGSTHSHFIINIVCAVCVTAVLLIFSSREEEGEESFEEDADYEEESFSYEEAAPDLSDAREAYPELFSERPSEDTPVEEGSYRSALSLALDAQRAGRAEEAEEKAEACKWEEELCEYLKKEEREETSLDTLSDLPYELPEGYSPYEEDCDEGEEEEEYESEESPVRGWAIKLIAAALLTAAPIVLALILSGTKTLYFADRIKVQTAFSEAEYSWEDCARYEVGPSFFGDRLSVKIVMKDGAKIELLPSDLSKNEELYEKYESEYDYALAVTAALERAGAKKEVREKNTLAGGLALREDIGEYVKKLCDIE